MSHLAFPSPKLAREEPQRIRFGSYEADLSSGELRKAGLRLKVQPQPFRILTILLRRHGQVVTRQDLQQALWPDASYGEFNVGLNAAVKKLRRTLSDSPRKPRYIETLPRKGYRFIYPLHPVAAASTNGGSNSRWGAAALDPAAPPTGTPSNHFASTSEVLVGAAPPPDYAVHARPSERRYLPWAVAALLAVAFLALAYVHFMAPQSERPVRRFSFAVEGALSADGAVISPDGKHILYTASTDGRRRLWLRALNDESLRELAGTAGATRGFWAPDGRSIGFAADGLLKRISLDGGDPAVVCELPERGSINRFRGGTWSADGQTIAFSYAYLLYEVSAGGGEAKLLFGREGETRGRFSEPHFLPGDGAPRGLVYTASVSEYDQMIEVLDLQTGVRRVLGPGSAPVYASDGALIHGPASRDRRGLSALPFSLEYLSTKSPAFPISETGRSASVSADGTLSYMDDGNGPLQLAVVDRSGEVVDTVGQQHQGVRQPTISPDGRRFAAAVSEAGNTDIRLFNPSEPAVDRFTTDPGADGSPAWSPDGKRIAFSRQGRAGEGDCILTKAVAGDAEPKAWVEEMFALRSPSWSSDGRYLAYVAESGSTQGDVLYVSEGENTRGAAPKIFLQTAADESSPRFSPVRSDLIAYVSDESGRREVYVASFPERGDPRQVSFHGGADVQWRGDGGELYYVDQTGSLVATPIGVDLRLGPATRLFYAPRLASAGYAPFADGSKFVTILGAEDRGPTGTTIRVIENWREGFRAQPR